MSAIRRHCAGDPAGEDDGAPTDALVAGSVGGVPDDGATSIGWHSTAASARALDSGDTSDRELVLSLAVLALAGAVMLLLPVTPRPETESDVEVERTLAVALALLIGFFGGMVGIAGIAFVIAALVYLLRVPPRIAIGTSLGVGLFAAVAGIVGKAATAQIDPPLAAIVCVAALVP